MKVKVCKKCGVEKQLDRFSKNKACLNGFTNECLDCKNKKQLELRNNNREYFNAISRRLNAKYRKQNPEKYRSKARASYQRNREKILNKNRKKYKDKGCMKCGSIFKPKSTIHKYCSRQCEAKANHRYYYEHKKHPILNCKLCGNPFIATREGSIYCSSKCGATYRYRNMSFKQKKQRQEKQKIYNLKNIKKIRDIKIKSAVKNKENRRYRETKEQFFNRLFIGNTYVKQKLKRQGCYTPDESIVELKRIHITLKRTKNERKNELAVNP